MECNSTIQYTYYSIIYSWIWFMVFFIKINSYLGYFTAIFFSYFLIASRIERLTAMAGLDFGPRGPIHSAVRLLPLGTYGALLMYSSGRLCSSFCGFRDSLSDAENNRGEATVNDHHLWVNTKNERRKRNLKCSQGHMELTLTSRTHEVQITSLYNGTWSVVFIISSPKRWTLFGMVGGGVLKT